MAFKSRRFLMFFDLQNTEELSDINFDIIIVGAGAAGITLAKKIESSGKRVALVEGGGEEWSDISQDCYKGQVIGDPYFKLDVARLRFFGGTTNHWAGWCRSFEEIDFQRSYLGPEYKWPITFNDIERYKDEACTILEIPSDFKDVSSADSNIKEIKFQFSPPVQFKEKYLKHIKLSSSITLLLNANLVDLVGENRSVNMAIFESFNGNQIKLSGNKIILAMGGIENSRFLLYMSQKHQNHFFDDKLPIGKFWMEHPHFTMGKALVDKKKVPGFYYSLNTSAQLSNRILNCGFRVEHLHDEGTKSLIRDVLCLAPRLGSKLVKLADKNLVCGVELRAAWEQAPNIENAVQLDVNSVDSFGIPRTILRWHKTEFDRKTVKKSVDEFNRWLLEIDGGRIQLLDWILNDKEYPENDELAGYHHMGGTRMHQSTTFGVVDANCKVHGSNNLFIAGSSVFTTGGHNNPTLPIVQLSLKLANHLII